MTMGERLRELRENDGLRQYELSEILGVSRATISRFEHGTCIPGRKQLLKLSELYSVTTDYLLCRTNDKVETVLLNNRAAPEAKYNNSFNLDDLIKQYSSFPRDSILEAFTSTLIITAKCPKSSEFYSGILLNLNLLLLESLMNINTRRISSLLQIRDEISEQITRFIESLSQGVDTDGD